MRGTPAVRSSYPIGGVTRPQCPPTLRERIQVAVAIDVREYAGEGDGRGPRAPPRSFFLQSEEDATAVAPQELTRLEFAKGRTCASAESARPSVPPTDRPTDRDRLAREFSRAAPEPGRQDALRTIANSCCNCSPPPSLRGRGDIRMNSRGSGGQRPALNGLENCNCVARDKSRQEVKGL